MTYVTAFFQFWYDFIIGDDWTVAALVVVGLAATWWLARSGMTVWWIMPVLSLSTLCFAVWRAKRRQT